MDEKLLKDLTDAQDYVDLFLLDLEAGEPTIDQPQDMYNAIWTALFDAQKALQAPRRVLITIDSDGATDEYSVPEDVDLRIIDFTALPGGQCPLCSGEVDGNQYCEDCDINWNDPDLDDPKIWED